MSQMTNDFDDMLYDDLMGDNGDPCQNSFTDYATSPVIPYIPESIGYINSERQNSQQDHNGIPIRTSVSSGIGHRTVDSGLSSMVTPASNLETSRDGRDIPIRRHASGNYSGASYSGQSFANVVSPTSSLKRSSVDGYENDDNKRWKNENSENAPILILAQANQQTIASHFPTTDTRSIPVYGARSVRTEYTPRTIQNDLGSLCGSGFSSSDRSAENGLARYQPIGQQIRTNFPGQHLTHTAEVNGVSHINSQIAMDVKTNFIDQPIPSTTMETSEPREKCSPQTSSALQGVLRRHTDNQVSHVVQKPSPPININGSAVGSEVSMEEDKRKRQQEKNRQYAKDSRDRKNEKLKKLEQQTKEQEAEIEILKKVVTHYYVKLHKSEPVWTENVRQWFPNQGGNSQTCIEVRCFLPNDEEMLRELGNSPYGSVISPVKSKQPQVKTENEDVIEITDDSTQLPPSAPIYLNGEASTIGIGMSQSKGPSALTPRKSLFSSRSYDRDSRESRPEVGFLDEAESPVDLVKDAKILENHRQEESYSLGLFSGIRAELKQHRIMKESPWNVTCPDQGAVVAQEAQIPSSGQDVECVTMTVDQFQEGLINGIYNLGSMDIFDYDVNGFVQGDQTEQDVI